MKLNIFDWDGFCFREDVLSIYRRNIYIYIYDLEDFWGENEKINKYIIFGKVYIL